jgi:hypothetical protein
VEEAPLTSAEQALQSVLDVGFPASSWSDSSTDPVVVRARRDGLEAWLRQLGSVQSACVGDGLNSRSHRAIARLLGDFLAPPSVQPALHKCRQLVGEIAEAMGGDWGEPGNDHICWARCKRANCKAGQALLAAAEQHRRVGLWPVALEFANEALVVAEQMPEFSVKAHNAARESAAKALRELRWGCYHEILRTQRRS